MNPTFLRLLAAFIILFVALALSAQAAGPAWTTIYNGPGAAGNNDDYGVAVVVDAAGNVAVTGASRNATGNFDIYTARYAGTDGSVLWGVRHDGPAGGDDGGNSVTVDAVGNVVIAGYSRSVNREDFYVAKYAAEDGHLLWEARYDGPGHVEDRAQQVLVNAAGDVIATGHRFGTNYDCYTAKYNGTTGTLVWEAVYDGPGHYADYAFAAALDGSGNVVITGSSDKVVIGSDIVTVKYDATDGHQLWDHRFIAGGAGRSVKVDAAGNVAVCGHYWGPVGSFQNDIYTARYDGVDGHVLWEKFYTTGTSSDFGWDLAVDVEGNVAIAGEGNSSNQFYTVKYAAADGVILWEKPITAQSSEGAYSIAADAAGNFVVAGIRNSNYYVVKYAGADGAVMWEGTYNRGSEGMKLSGPVKGKVALIGDEAVVTGSSNLSPNGRAYATVRFEIVTQPPVLALPASVTVTKSPVSVDFTLPEAALPGSVKLTFGAVVLTLAASQEGAGRHTFTFNPVNPVGGAVASITGGVRVADGTHTVTLGYRDAGSNPEALAFSTNVEIDTVVPNTTIASGPPTVTNNTSGDFTFTASEPSGFEVSLDGGLYVATPGMFTTPVLAGGTHSLAVRARDPAGNVDATPATQTWVVELTPPDTAITTGPPAVTNDVTADFTFTASESATFSVSLDGGNFVPASSPFATPALADGSHTLVVRATDAAGNVDPTPAMQTWVVDTLPPDTAIATGPPMLTNDATADFTFSATGPAIFSVSLDGGNFVPASSPFATPPLADGSHTLAVRATDAAGNVDPTPAMQTWVLDTLPPDTTIATGPPAVTNDATADFTFSATGPATLSVSLDGGSFVAASSPFSTSALPDGTHTLAVRATDAAGNTDPTPATRMWVVDTVTLPPTFTAPAASTAVNTMASVSFSLPEAAASGSVLLRFTPNVGGLPLQITLKDSQGSAGAHAFTFNPANPAAAAEVAGGDVIPDGMYSVRLQYSDAAGNTAASVTHADLTIDTTAPTITGPFTPLTLTGGAGGRVALPDYLAQATFTDASTVTTTSQDPTPGTLVPVGTTTVTIFAEDMLGNAGTITFNVTVNQGSVVVAQFLGKGDPVPGAGIDPRIPAGAKFRTFGSPAINDAGDVAFLASWKTGSGIFAGNPAVLIVKIGDPAPGTGTTFKSFKNPVLDGNGTVATIAKLTSGTSAVFTDGLGGAQLLARTGTPAPGGGNFATLTGISLRGGNLLVAGTLDGPPATAPGIWSYTSTGSSLLVRKGMQAPGVGNGVTIKNWKLLTSVAGSTGQGGQHTGTQGELFSATYSTPGLMALIDGTGDADTFTGDLVSGTFAAEWETFGPVQIITGGASALRATLVPQVGGVVSLDAIGIFFSPDNGVSYEPTIRTGTTVATGLPVGATFSALKDPVLGPGPGLAFAATASGPGITSADNQGIWWLPAGSPLSLVARKGAQATDAPTGALWKKFISLALPGGDCGPIFTARLALNPTAHITEKNDLGLWAVTSTDTVRALLREGDKIGTRKVSTFSILEAIPGSPGTARAFNANGLVVLHVDYTDGTSGIVKIEVP